MKIGDTLSVIELDGFILLAPKISDVPKLAAEIEQLREEAGLSLGDLLEGLDEQHHSIYDKKDGIHW